jgi:hypothetical protein
MAGDSGMTTCSESLRALSTMKLADIPADSGIAGHIATCPSCSRLVTEMQYADQRLSNTLTSAIPITPPTVLAADALTRSEMEDRESVARWFRRGLAVAAGLLVVFFLRSDPGRYMTGQDDFQQQRFELKCLSRERALDLGSAQLYSHRGRIFRTYEGSVTVEGRTDEVNAALNEIERADKACELRPGAAPKAPASTTGKD